MSSYFICFSFFFLYLWQLHIPQWLFCKLMTAVFIMIYLIQTVLITLSFDDTLLNTYDRSQFSNYSLWNFLNTNKCYNVNFIANLFYYECMLLNISIIISKKVGRHGTSGRCETSTSILEFIINIIHEMYSCNVYECRKLMLVRR